MSSRSCPFVPGSTIKGVTWQGATPYAYRRNGSNWSAVDNRLVFERTDQEPPVRRRKHRIGAIKPAKSHDRRDDASSVRVESVSGSRRRNAEEAPASRQVTGSGCRKILCDRERPAQ
jgi:hypothetical protein